MSENQQSIQTETPSVPENQTNLLFDDPDKKVSIESGKEEATKSNVKIEADIINNTLNFMTLKGAAWPSTHQAFVHLSLLFMNRDWYGDNEFASKMNETFEKAPFTAKQTKLALKSLADIKVLETKNVKGKPKYKLSQMGEALISSDKVIMKLLGFEREPNVTQTVEEENKAKVEASATLKANIAGATEGRLVQANAEVEGDTAAAAEQHSSTN